MILKPLKGTPFVLDHPRNKGNIVTLLLNEGIAAGLSIFDQGDKERVWTFFNMPPLGSWAESSPSGAALTFDGGDDSITTPNDPVLNPSDGITVSIISKNSVNQLGGLFSLWSESSARKAYTLYHSGGMRFNIGGGAEAYISNASGGFLGNWKHTIGTYDRNNVTIYQRLLKGGPVMKDSTPFGDAIKTNTVETVDIGRFNQGILYRFNGLIAYIGVWNRGFTENEALDEICNPWARWRQVSTTRYYYIPAVTPAPEPSADILGLEPFKVSRRQFMFRQKRDLGFDKNDRNLTFKTRR